MSDIEKGNIKEHELIRIVSDNLKRITTEHDLSSRDLASRSGLPQKTAWSIVEGRHNARLDTVGTIADALLVSPAALMLPNLPLSVLMSRRVPRLIENYAKLSIEQRDRLEAVVNGMLAED